MTDDEIALFQAAMRGVKPLVQECAPVGKRKIDNACFARLRQAASSTLDGDTTSPALSDQFMLDALPEQHLHWAADGVQKSQMQRLERGQLSLAGSLDLHGMSVERAREQLLSFLAEAQALSLRCVRVVHGKSGGNMEKPARLKSLVNSWLRQHPQVLGFSSCLPRHGGTGAVYVLLRKEEGL